MHDGFSLPQKSWIALLSIADRYEFLNVRERAIREIYHSQQRGDPVLLVSLGEKYDVPPRDMLLSLAEVVMRANSLTADEVACFSTLTMSRLARAREDFVRGAAEATNFRFDQHFQVVDDAI
jgi:hypothetical protein